MMRTRVIHEGSYVTHAMELLEEDVEARLLIPGQWTSTSKEYLILVIRHLDYILVSRLVKGDLGYSMLSLCDSYYPKFGKFGRKKKLEAKSSFINIIDALTGVPFTRVQDIHRQTAAYLNRLGYIRECASLFADLSMDFEILGPILEYCGEAILAFQRVTGEVIPYGCRDSHPNEDTSRQQPGPGDVDQNRGQNEEEPRQCLSDSLP